MISSHSQHSTRYSCLECRADAQAFMNERLHPDVQQRYLSHISQCKACARAHRTLIALYQGPQDFSAISHHLPHDREFLAVLRQLHGKPTASKMSGRNLRSSTLLGLCSSFAFTLFIIFSTWKIPFPQENLHAKQHSANPEARAEAVEFVSDRIYIPEQGGVNHHAQVDYGRIIAGRASLFDDQHQQALTTDIFQVGTRFKVAARQNLQVRFIGKILANFGPEAHFRWEKATPDEVHLRLQHGLLAVRYDRLPQDPILKIYTPTAVVRIVGTIFTVEVDDAGNTSVAVLRGKVEVLDIKHERVISEVQAGYRFNVHQSTYADLGRREVAIALPLSNETSHRSRFEADGRIPTSWVVPGLPTDPNLRTLEHLAYTGERGSSKSPQRTSNRNSHSKQNDEMFSIRHMIFAPLQEDEGEELIENLQREMQEDRRRELKLILNRCNELYQSTHTRYMAARCITDFMRNHENDREIVEGWLLYGILRMDYANDYPAAIRAFEKFIEQAPNHVETETAMYRLWLANTEAGKINKAEEQGRNYLRSFPNGRYAGKILQRFPKLIAEI